MHLTFYNSSGRFFRQTYTLQTNLKATKIGEVNAGQLAAAQRSHVLNLLVNNVLAV